MGAGEHAMPITAPWRAKAGPRRRGRILGEAAHLRLVLVVVGLLRRGDPPTPFAREGMLIAAVRSAIVLRGGWHWCEADASARLVVHEALRTIGAKRLSWREASTPHFAQNDAFSFIERTRCRQCGWKLPETCRAFCGPRCRTLYHTNLCAAEAAANAAMAAEAL